MSLKGLKSISLTKGSHQTPISQSMEEQRPKVRNIQAQCASFSNLHKVVSREREGGEGEEAVREAPMKSELGG